MTLALNFRGAQEANECKLGDVSLEMSKFGTLRDEFGFSFHRRSDM